MSFFIKKSFILILLIILVSCANYGQLDIVTRLPNVLSEVSGVQTIQNSNLIWMINDGGNPHRLYGVSRKGKIKEEFIINAKNEDWEDLTSDDEGNLYIGDFGNNYSKRKDLTILKIKHTDLQKEEDIDVERIRFYFPEQKKFPPKKKQRYFDTESFIFLNGYLYLFTRSRVSDNYGKTSLYKIPAKEGNHAAQYISSFTFCNLITCSITSAAISDDKKSIVLLSSETVLHFTDFNGDDFFSGKVTPLPLDHLSQKEGVCFKNENTLYITDEKAYGTGGKLYEFKL
jgi:hypothetical protein